MSIENANSHLECATKLQEQLRSCNCPTVLFRFVGDKLVVRGKVPSWADMTLRGCIEDLRNEPYQLFGFYVRKECGLVMCWGIDDEWLEDWMDEINGFAREYFVALRTDI